MHCRGKRAECVKRGFQKARRNAGILCCTPHDLRRTAITWACQGGAQMQEIESSFGTTPEELRRTY